VNRESEATHLRVKRVFLGGPHLNTLIEKALQLVFIRCRGGSYCRVKVDNDDLVQQQHSLIP
jgi:hypothetical protein